MRRNIQSNRITLPINLKDYKGTKYSRFLTIDRGGRVLQINAAVGYPPPLRSSVVMLPGFSGSQLKGGEGCSGKIPFIPCIPVNQEKAR